MKKFLAILISVMLVLSLSVFAFAEGGTPAEPVTGSASSAADAGNFSITIDNAVPEETYNAYKIFDVTYSGSATPNPNDAPDAPAPDGRSFHNNYSYSIKSNSEWWNVVTTDYSTSPATTHPTAAETTAGTFTVNNLVFTKSTASDGITWTVTAGPQFDAAEFASLLADNVTGKTPANATPATVSSPATSAEYDDPDNLNRGTATITGLAAGYYFVTTSLGAVCSLDTTEPNALIREKNDVPDIDKDVKGPDATDTTWGKATDADIGDTVSFKLTVTDGAGTNQAITIHDVMASGLTLDTNSFTFTFKDDQGDALTLDSSLTNLSADTDPADSCTFEITLPAALVAALDAGDVVEIVYTAKLNENATIYATPNTNETWLDYSNQETTHKEVDVYTYDFDIVKVDSTGNLLPGAKFKLERTAGTTRTGETSPIKFVKTGNSYRVATDAEIAANGANLTTELTSSDGKYHIEGLDAETYTLTEIEAPEGYNLLKDSKTVTIKPYSDTTAPGGAYDGNNRWTTTLYTETIQVPVTDEFGEDTGTTEAQVTHPVDTVEVINQSGSELPSTGGIGTTIFYIVGAILVLGAAIILIAKRRSAAAEA
jgi:fimbrial isopeptide formation D2 family protein/LPXTG-motif cell wall-anchored protein